MDPILETIDEALQRKGLSDAAASKLAVGHPSLIKNMRMQRKGEKRYNLPALQKLAGVLDLEFYFGPPREPELIQNAMIAGEDYAAIPRYEVEVSAGPGALNHREEVVEQLAFRRDWLRRLRVSPANAYLLKVRGDSMATTLRDGDMVLIDQARARIRSGVIYGLVDIDGETRVKRLDRPDARTLVLRSDNPAHSTEVRQDTDAERVRILGEIVWSGHTWIA